MEILPAIDLRGGQVVRLLQGEYKWETVYDDSPATMGKRWEDGGAKWIHIVDLDGAREGMIRNQEAIQSITETVGVSTELGGGLRDMDSIAFALDGLGVNRAILGSVLLENPDLGKEAVDNYPHRIVLGIDARDGKVATRGWRETSEVLATDLLEEFSGLPFAGVIYTDIKRDGTLQGPNLDELKSVAEASEFPVIASGGIGTLEDIRAVAALPSTLSRGEISGIIVGKALYENKFSLMEAIQALQPGE